MSSELSWRKRARRFWHKIAENLRLSFYVRTQKYSVSYTVVVANASNQDRNFQILLPVPLSTEYQTVIKQPTFNLNDFQLIADKDFGNVAALYSGRIAAEQEIVLKQQFEVEVRPRVTAQRLERMNLRSCKHIKSEKINELKNEKNAEDKAGDDRDDLRVLKELNDAVSRRFCYGDAIKGLYTVEEALKRDKVDCGGFDVALATAAQGEGYSARILSGFWAGYEKNTMHAWLEVQLPDGRVVPMDPSVEKLVNEGRSDKSGRFGFLGSDRIVFSRGCCLPFQINGQEMMVELLQHPFLLPHDPDLSYALDVKVEVI